MAASTWSAAAIVAVATVVVSIANLIFLWINARATRQFEERSQRTARKQARIEDTYSNFITLMHRSYVSADYVLSEWKTPNAPHPVQDREISEAIGRLRAFGSDAAVEAADRWANAHTDVVVAIVEGVGNVRGRIDEMRGGRGSFGTITRRELGS